MTVRAIRGAIQVEADDPALISEAAVTLMSEVVGANSVLLDDIISVLFTMTPDLTSDFPARAVRSAGLGEVPLMCASEIAVPGATPRVIRLLAHVVSSRPRSEIHHIYLRGAAVLRPDLALNSK